MSLYTEKYKGDQVLVDADVSMNGNVSVAFELPDGYFALSNVSDKDLLGMASVMTSLILDRAEAKKEGASKVVCLCGSTRFYKTFKEANYRETMDGKIVLSVGFALEDDHGEQAGCTPEQKVKLDKLHLRKIEMADEVLAVAGAGVGAAVRRLVAGAEGDSGATMTDHLIIAGLPFSIPRTCEIEDCRKRPRVAMAGRSPSRGETIVVLFLCKGCFQQYHYVIKKEDD